ncbi:hypothetical protein [Amycolatopsis sp. H20-H5]|uniref:hypothetical protein n=1 Tax=Amycolatopsis sp. H20-H5 TaxID=3046309 RepID=UPI002DBDF231|nr:hypothetical protein [Amycolatopsis sp. H20-H5]MEC3978151.1 hypothetical protein [Amycolatopsis sp. H20-H5]
MQKELPHTVDKTPGEIRKYQQVEQDRVAEQQDSLKAEVQARAERLGSQYPQIDKALKEHARRSNQELDAMRTPGRPRLSTEERADHLKREYWEFLSILVRAVPDLPIVEMHDEAAAQIDAMTRQGQEQERAIRTSTEQTKEALGNAAIDHYVANKDRAK